MSGEDRNIQAELISKYLAGEATPEEAMGLHDWLKDPENEKEYERIAQLWNELPASQPMVSPNTLQAWSELQQNLSSSKTIYTSLYRYIVAACLLGFIVFMAFLWFNKTESNQDINSDDQLASIVKHANTNVVKDTLPDGSVVTINKGSSISYKPTFNQTDRQVFLNGECYFDVVPDKAKPFTINVDDLNIRVIGTSFNVHQILPTKSIEVQVQSGVVKMYTKTKEISVQKGQTGIYTKANGALNLKDNIDINSIGYATASFSFQDLSLEDACKYLEKAFNVKFIMDKQKFAECRITAHFTNKSLQYILEIINATLNTTSKQEGSIIYIYGRGCA